MCVAEAVWTVHAEADPPALALAHVFAREVPPTVAARQGKTRVDRDGGLLDRAFATRQRFWLLDEF